MVATDKEHAIVARKYCCQPLSRCRSFFFPIIKQQSVIRETRVSINGFLTICTIWSSSRKLVICGRWRSSATERPRVVFEVSGSRMPEVCLSRFSRRSRDFYLDTDRLERSRSRSFKPGGSSVFLFCAFSPIFPPFSLRYPFLFERSSSFLIQSFIIGFSPLSSLRILLAMTGSTKVDSKFIHAYTHSCVYIYACVC